MAVYPYIPFILSLLLLLTLSSSSNPNTIITLPLSPSPLFTKSQSSSDLFQTLKTAASASLTRAHHLKNHKPSHNSHVDTPVFSKSYGGYSIDLNFGTPPQTLSFVFDTGSTLVWFPCSYRYLCSNCKFANSPPKIPTFIPRNSSSSKLLGCTHPKCAFFFGSDVPSRCQGCNPTSQKCNNITCPAYQVQYGSGSTTGFLLLENLHFPLGEINVPDFLVGCSFLSSRQPAGIAGFGRGPDSLPSQMGLKRFSHCLLSHKFDDLPENSDLVLEIDSNGDKKSNGLSYTPFQKNPKTNNTAFFLISKKKKNNTAFLVYYYLNLRKVIVGGKRVKIPLELLEPGSDGNGGTIVDSGSTFTFMERPIFDLVAKEFEKQMLNFTRARDIEAGSGSRLGLCFDLSGVDTVTFPELVFQFKGGAKMVLPVQNYFSLVGEAQVACLTFVSDGTSGPESTGGPAIILGNYQQQNFKVEYDLENDRFGFGPQNCQKTG